MLIRIFIFLSNFILLVLSTLIDCPHLNPTLSPFSSLYANVVSLQDVFIPSGARILLTKGDIKNVTLNRITIQGTLVFDDNDMAINVREIFVDVGGKLLVGDSRCRMRNKIDIIFHGTKLDSSFTDTVTGMTSKGLIANGLVEMHGKQFSPTWTRLQRTAAIGDTTIYLKESVNWEVGQTILLTTTVFLDCPDVYAHTWCDGKTHQNEQHVITAVRMNSSIGVYAITLNAGLRYAHFAGLEYQGEVALLSRNIRLLGSVTNDKFGGHVKIKDTTAQGKFSGILAQYMGQLNILGRYPFHFHLMFNASLRESYVQESVVLDSFFRCYVVHGTNYTRLSHNIAYNALGSCYYLEDGVEENNIIEGNLASHITPIYRPAEGGWGQGGEVFTEIPDQLLIPSDTAAAGFYISNAMNMITGNCASGGWTGFAFPNLVEPMGMFKGLLYPYNRWDPFNPLSRPLLKFEDNVAHSCGFYWQSHGSCIYVGAKLEYMANGVMRYTSGRFSRDTMLSDGTETYMTFRRINVFLGNKGVAHWGNNLQIEDSIFQDVRTGAMVFGDSALSNVIISAFTTNPNNEVLKWVFKQGFQFYDTWTRVILSGVTFKNFPDASKGCAVSYMDHSDHYLPQGINAAREISFVNVDPAATLCLQHCGPECGVTSSSMSSRINSVWDFDGSLSQTGRPSIIGSNSAWWNIDSLCVKNSFTHLWVCPWTDNIQTQTYSPLFVANSSTIGFIGMEIPGVTGNCNTSVSSECTDQFSPYTVGTVSHWGTNWKNSAIDLSLWSGVAGRTHMGWYWSVSSSALDINGSPSFFSLSKFYQMPRGSFIVLAIAYPPSTEFSITMTYWSSPVNKAFPMSSLSAVLYPEEDLLNPDLFKCSSNHWTDFCEETGGQGFVWHFDGTYLYLRIVPFLCYHTYERWTCEDDTFFAYGARVGSMKGGHAVYVNATCPSCNTQKVLPNGIKFYHINTTTPPSKTLEELSMGYTYSPTKLPTAPPTHRPTGRPTLKPTKVPTTQPTKPSTIRPTTRPTTLPSLRPSRLPTIRPTTMPSLRPSRLPTIRPTTMPSLRPSRLPTIRPTALPSLRPSRLPTIRPTALPSLRPSRLPTIRPTALPSLRPSRLPTTRPTALPSLRPSRLPTRRPS